MKSQFGALPVFESVGRESLPFGAGFLTLLTKYTGFVIPVVHGGLHGELVKGLIARWCSFLLLIEIVFAVFDGADMLMERMQQTPNSRKFCMYNN